MDRHLDEIRWYARVIDKIAEWWCGVFHRGHIFDTEEYGFCWMCDKCGRVCIQYEDYSMGFGEDDDEDEDVSW